jgi:O-antigen/teichoic acid export membrane protein
MQQDGKPAGGLGGGGAWLGLAKLWFLLTSYAISIALTHLLLPDAVGRYSVVTRLVAVPNMVLIYTVLFSVSRPMAADFDRGVPSYHELRRRGLRLGALLGGVVSVTFFALAPVFASVLGDDVLVDPIRVVAPISLVYALYATNLGTLNAVRRFRRQAALDIAMAASKAALIIGAAAAGLGLSATLGGFTVASVLALALSVAMVAGLGPPGGGRERAASMAGFAGVLILFTTVVNLLQSVDLLVLKSFAATQADEDAMGFYASAQWVALVPYSLMNAVALLMFPLVAAIDQERERDKVRRYLGETAKVSILLLAFMSSIGSACASDIQALLFPKAYGVAGDWLRRLVWGFSGYSLCVTIAWVFNSARQSKVAVALVLVPLVTVFVAELLTVPVAFAGGASLSVAIAGGVAALAALAALAWRFGATVPLLHVLKIAAAVSAVEIVARLWPEVSSGGLVGKLAIVAKLGVLAAVFVGVVLTTKAVTAREIRELRRAP